MMSIPYGRQSINQSDIDSVLSVLRSNFLTQGPLVPEFESKFSIYSGSKFAIAVNSATSALHIACLALDVGRGDIVWTSPITFVASANCALYCGASIDFVDIDPCTYNLCIDKLEAKLVEAKRIGCLPKVVIPVHMAGQPCNMAKIYELSEQYGFSIIEDASHAVGAKFCDKELFLESVGSCKFSDITVFSFHPVKIITTGEGGMLTTNNADLAKRLRLLRSHGITNITEDLELRPSDEIWNYQQVDLGFNYRMTDLQAALGISQMDRLDQFVMARHKIAKSYNELLSGLPLTLPWQDPTQYSSFHLYIIRLKKRTTQLTQKKIHELFLRSGVGVNLHYIPVYLHPYYRNLGFEPGYCPEAEKYFHEAITLPLYPGLTEDFQNIVVENLKSYLL